MSNTLNTLKSFLASNLEVGPWGIALFAASLVLGMAFLLSLSKGKKKVVGQVGGPVILAISFAVFCGFVGVTARMLEEIALSIPIFGRLLVLPLKGAAMLIGAVWLGSVMTETLSGAFNILRRSILGRVTPVFVLAGAFGISLAVSCPTLNQATWYLPSILSCLLGLYTILFRRSRISVDEFIEEETKEQGQSRVTYYHNPIRERMTRPAPKPVRQVVQYIAPPIQYIDCPYCGHKVPEDMEADCRNCGAPVAGFHLSSNYKRSQA